MSSSEFDSLVAAFLEGNASESQVARLRSALGQSPELRARFQSRVRLHKAQLSFLSRREERSISGVMVWLHAFGQRMGRSFAHLCLLALVLVELQVTIPAEYSGLLSYVDAPAAEEQVLAGTEAPLRLLTDADTEERRLLGAFAYNQNDAIVHTDMAPLPRSPKARSKSAA